MLGYFLIAAAVFAMIGLAKFAAKRRKKTAPVTQDPFAGSPIAGGAGTPPAMPQAAVAPSSSMSFAQTGSVMADSVTDDTPLGGRIKRRQQEQLAAEQAALMPPPVAADPAPLLGQAPPSAPPVASAAPVVKKSMMEGVLPKVLIAGVVLIALSQMVPGLAFLPIAALPLTFIGGIWFLMFKLNKKVSKGVDALRGGVEDQTNTVAKVGG